MATLKLVIGGSYPARSPNGGDAMIADIVPFTADGQPGPRRSITVLPSEVNVIEQLEPGSWEVKLVTPTGVVISHDVEIAAGRENTVRISLPSAIATQRRRKPGIPDPARPVRARPARRGGFLTKALGLGGQDEHYAGGFLAAQDPAPRSLYGATPTDRSHAGIVTFWSNLAAGIDGVVDTTRMLSADWGGAPTPTAAATVGVWEIPPPVPHSGKTRVWIEVSSGDRRRIHSAPVPWTAFDWGDMVLLSTGSGESKSFDSDISLVDQRFAGIISYLASGAVSTAARLLVDGQTDVLRDAGSMLRGKGQCPLGAAAAGYVLVGSSNLASPAKWHDWIANLNALFPWLPDGAILAARLRLLSARSEDEARAALPALKEALFRGLPFYSVGLGWLLASMKFFEDDPLISEVRPLVERVAAAIDMDAPFTTLDARARA